MLKIKYPGIQYNAAFDTSKLPAELPEAVVDPTVLALKAGKVAGLDSSGNVTLAGDGATAIGFIINDAAGYWLENKPAFGSGKLPITLGNCVVETDQIDATRTYVAGEKLYLMSGANAGKLTNDSGAVVTPASATIVNVTVKFAGGAAGNGEQIKLVEGGEGAPVVNVEGKVATVTAKSGTTTQGQIAEALKANHPRVIEATATNAGTAITFSNGSGDTATASNGSDGTPTKEAFGLVTVGATPANPVIELAVI